MISEARRSALSVSIVGAEERSNAAQDGNSRGDFPKRELAGGAQPRPATVLAVTSIARPATW
jgi:hypothetical protein